ncbi:hypothetical protein ACFQE8_05150 [Salinirubellus sp. GCM10025818]|jgi:hypothetical protein|uniref:hypothetical protein n=1 Tax=Salinirubellus TaxID=2162630 RepID=UPI0030CFBDE0
MTDDTSRPVSRRGVLRTLGAGGAVAVGATGLGAAQSGGADYTARMVVPGAEEFTDDYAGLFVYVEAQSESELTAEDVSGCEFENWSPDGLDSFTGRLVDQIDDDHRDIPTQIFTTADSGIEAGALYVVNRAIPCPDAYVGLEVEQIRTENLDQGTNEDPETAAGTTGGDGPGFGVAGALAGVGGLAGLARVLRDGEE